MGVGGLIFFHYSTRFGHHTHPRGMAKISYAAFTSTTKDLVSDLAPETGKIFFG